MSFIPSFKLYAANGSSLIYTFEYIQSPIEGWPSDAPSNIEITNLRSQGSINIPGGNKSFDIILHGILIAEDYTALTTKIFSLRDTIVANTNYVLKLPKSNSTTNNINVKRLLPIVFEESNRVTMQKYSIIFRANSW